MFRTRFLILLALIASYPAFAATLPSDLEPLPEPPPAPEGYEPDPEIEPQVTITKRGEDIVEEYSVNGQVYMMKVTPPNGVPYYLSKDSADGGWQPMDGPGEHYSMPSWVLFRF
jgi:hypothetical protein